MAYRVILQFCLIFFYILYMVIRLVYNFCHLSGHEDKMHPENLVI
jgi:hypothetical protein